MTAQQLHDKLKAGGVKFYGEVVLVAREKAQETSRSGIIFIPEEARARQQFAAVVSFGDKSCFSPGGDRLGQLSIGDAVYMPAYGGVVLKQKIGDEVFVLEALYDKDILLSYRGNKDVELEAGGSQTSA